MTNNQHALRPGKATLLILLIITLLTASVNAEDYYKTLGIKRNAKDQEIRKAYKARQVELHPDTNPGDEEKYAMFELLERAHFVLTDPQRKQIYDHHGFKELEKQEAKAAGHSGAMSKVKIRVSLLELFNGTKREMEVKRNRYCSACHGTGAEGGVQKTCPKCKGRGHVMENVQMGPMTMQMEQPCRKCKGRGKIFKHICPICAGHKLVQEGKVFSVDVVKGSKSGDTIKFVGAGEQIVGQPEGDLQFVLQQSKHKNYRRVGDNLYANMKISLEQAMLGFTRTIKHLDDHEVKVHMDGQSVVQPFSWHVVKGEGMPLKGSWNSYGDLHIKFIVDFPVSLTTKQREMIDKIFPQA